MSELGDELNSIFEAYLSDPLPSRRDALVSALWDNKAGIIACLQSRDTLVKVLMQCQRIIERDFPNGQLAIDIRAALQKDI